MPTIAPSERSQRLSAIYQPDPAGLAKLDSDVLGNLENWRPAEFPDRPATLTLTNDEIVDGLKARRRGANVSAETQAQLVMFGAWRAAVWRTELGNSGRLLVLLGVLDRLASDEKSDVEVLHRVEEFVSEWYNGLRVTYPIPYGQWRQRTAERYAENRALLPLGLRLGEKEKARGSDG